MLRQQSKTTDVISGYITNGGSAINIIPDYTSAVIATRAPTKKDLEELDRKVKLCFEAGSISSGATIKMERFSGYDDHVTNPVLANSYKKWFNALGGRIPGSKEDLENGVSPGGTDQGNVSHITPSLHALFYIDSPCGPHQAGFAEAAKAESALDKALMVAKALALTAVDILVEKGLLEEVKQSFADKEKLKDL